MEQIIRHKFIFTHPEMIKRLVLWTILLGFNIAEYITGHIGVIHFALVFGCAVIAFTGSSPFWRNYIRFYIKLLPDEIEVYDNNQIKRFSLADTRVGLRILEKEYIGDDFISFGVQRKTQFIALQSGETGCLIVLENFNPKDAKIITDYVERFRDRQWS